MSFIADHLGSIVVLFGLLAGAAYTLMKWKNMTAKERESSIKGWLLSGVLLMEKEYGGGTGKIKLSTCWAEFCKTMPWLAKIISFDRFSQLVDEVLPEMRKLLETNTSVAAIVEKEEKVEKD